MLKHIGSKVILQTLPFILALKDDYILNILQLCQLPPQLLPKADFQLPKLTLVIGGARSGKSMVAEKIITSSGLLKTYIATAQTFDDTEMQNRIKDHQKRRGIDWKIIEEPFKLSDAIAFAKPNEAILIDCVTLWLSNLLLSYEHSLDDALAGLDNHVTQLINSIHNCAASIIIVSNETGLGIVPENKLARLFRDAQGTTNQRLANCAGLVIGVMAGIPFALKDTRNTP